MTNKIDEILAQNNKNLTALRGDPDFMVERHEKKVRENTPEPIVNIIVKPGRWRQILSEYLSDEEVDVKALAKKYMVEPKLLYDRVKQENWEAKRKNVFARVDAKMLMKVEETASDVKVSHIKQARILQKIGLKSIKKLKVTLEPKEALMYVVEGVKMEREAYGMGKDQPKIVNIITQQQAIIDKYKKRV